MNRKNKRRKPLVNDPNDPYPRAVAIGGSVGVEYRDARSGEIKRMKIAMTRNRNKENWEAALPHLPYPGK